MKKTFLYVCAVAILAIILPSCLGDNESTYAGSREFGVISTSNGVKRAAVPGMGGLYITWDGISSYSDGDAMLVSYKVSSSNYASGTNVLKAEYATVANGDLFPVNEQKNVTNLTVDTIKRDNSAFFKSFRVNMYSVYPFFSDKWLLSYTAGKKDGEVLTANFYYDASKQKQKNGAALPANTAIVDVVFTKGGVPVGTTTIPEDKTIVVNMDQLRTTLRPSTTNASVTVSIWFRLMMEDSKATGGYTLAYLDNVGALVYSKSE